MLAITGATVALVMVLLLIVYRSVLTAAIPLVAVGIALGVARPIVAALGAADVVEVSIFSVAMLAAMMLGAGTDYGIFLIGRYHEGRRAGLAPAPALAEAYRRVAPVIAGSALTVAVALAALDLAHIGMLRSAGIPCAIGILIAMAASLTLTPALLAIGARFGAADRAGRGGLARRWRRIGTTVVRWPAPVLVAATCSTRCWRSRRPASGWAGTSRPPPRPTWNPAAATPPWTGTSRPTGCCRPSSPSPPTTACAPRPV
uniref:MMPL family transporter n=1 Tax=Mycolicibacterium insubricum TaxID=444597 RepID=UPI0021F303BA|nr:MMPL family transporter [Mycolicibacterium insubricum]